MTNHKNMYQINKFKLELYILILNPCIYNFIIMRISQYTVSNLKKQYKAIFIMIFTPIEMYDV